MARENKVHALIVCPCGCGIRTRCGVGKNRDGTFLYRAKRKILPKGTRAVPITCKLCQRLRHTPLRA